MTKMIPAAEFKAAFREMLDGLGDGPLEADALKVRLEALVDAVPAKQGVAGTGSLRGALAHPAYRFDDPFSPAHDGPWDAEKDGSGPRG